MSSTLYVFETRRSKAEQKPAGEARSWAPTTLTFPCQCGETVLVEPEGRRHPKWTCKACNRKYQVRAWIHESRYRDDRNE